MPPVAIRDLEDQTHSNQVVKQTHHSGARSRLSQEHDLVLKTLRLIVADLCQQFGGGHPGGAIGMMAIGVALWKYAMRYAPHRADWFNRDRFVLSNGHTCVFQYTFLHMSGYRDMTLDQLKSYHSDRTDALCPGHPEIEHEGIEVTTGPLGQGITNAVGLAMATKHLAAEFNRPGYDVVSNHTWCTVGDACLQEGVGLEAISLAGHLRLNNLTVIYDNNQVTCDGSVDVTNTEDINAKMRACNWNVIDVEDGNYDVNAIVDALEQAKRSDKPTFINVRTIIGVGSAVAGMAVAHGAAIGKDNVAQMKKSWGFDPEQHFMIPAAVRAFFSELPERGDQWVAEYDQLLESYSEAYPDLARIFSERRAGKLQADWQSYIPESFPQDKTPSRKANGLVCNPLAANVPSFMVGTADLTPSVHMTFPNGESFQHPSHKPTLPFKDLGGSYSGRYIYYGIREHAMAAIANGLAAYSPGTILPVTSTFFMFYIYNAPAVRMGALQGLQVIHVATHDSIGTGEDGPTHQPIELAALYRAMPNMLYFRPADSEETAGCWIQAVEHKTGPSIISTSRHALPQYAEAGLTKRDMVAKGAYVVRELSDPSSADITIIGVGAEFSIAEKLATKLSSAPYNLKVRLVSFPCFRIFDSQPLAYRRSVLRRHTGNTPAFFVEAYSAFGWERYADAGFCMGTKRFGQSLPGPKAYEYFGFTADQIAPRVLKFLDGWKDGTYSRGEFVELSEYPLNEE